METLLEIKNLVKKYDSGKVAVDDISLTIKKGKIFGFIGHNGAGKTTTIKCIVGLLKYNKGEILYNNKNIQENIIEFKKQIAYIPDNPDLYEYLTGSQYLNFIADIYQINKKTRQEEITKYAKMFDIENALGGLISSFSHGMKQKIAIISALIRHPKLLILDASLNSDTPITKKTVFRLASMTKPITAVAAMILVERDMLSLDDTIDMYIPAFKNVKIVNTSGNESIPQNIPTIRNLLNHTSGIGGDERKLAKMTANDKATLNASIAFYAKIGLDFEPGTRQMYSGYASFDVLTRIIEIASGTDYLKFLTTEIFEPCGMVDTTFLPNEDQQERMSDMHRQLNGENAVAEMYPNCIFEDFPSAHYLGGAGLVSTLQDYSNFAKMLLNKGKVGKKRILKEETFNQLCTPQVSPEIMPNNYRWGFGMRVIMEDAYLPTSSFGWSGAYGTHFWIDPINKIFAVFMKNSRIDGGAGNESAVKLEQAVYTAWDI